MSAKKQAELRKIAEGREAEMFAWDEGTILRLLRSADATLRNQCQAAAMEAARSRGVRVPAVREVVAVMGRPGIVMERIEGTDLMTLIGRRPWTVLRAGRICGEVQAQLHAVRAPSAIPPLRAVLRARIQAASSLLQGLEGFALQALETLPDGDRLCHGDYHPGNILMDGRTPVLIDWTNATRGEPAADVARTRLMLRLGEPPPGTSLALRVMSLFGRNILLYLYLRSYRRLQPLDAECVARWEVPVAAARLAEGIEGEFPALLALLEKASRRSG